MQTTEAIRVLQCSLHDEGPMDEDAYRCLGILEERLEQLKMKSALFQDVAFSEEVERLARRSAAVAVN